MQTQVNSLNDLSNGPAGLLLKPLVHDMADGLEIAATMLKMLQRPDRGSRAETANLHLDSVISKLFRLMGLTEDYCSLFLCLDKKGKIPAERLDLQADVIDLVLAELADAFSRKNLSLIHNRNKNAAYYPAAVYANRVLFRSVFRTLFNNAIRSCGQGGTITYGLSKSEKGHMVQLFYDGQPRTDTMAQAGRSTVWMENSAGYSNSAEEFGLSMADSIISHFGGILSCESWGKGFRLIVTLPAEGPVRN